MFQKIHLSLFLFLLCFTGLIAQDYQYEMSLEKRSDHLYKISLTTTPAAGATTDFQIPAWRPGRYIIQDYAAGVSGFGAVDENGKALKWKKTDNNTWQVQKGTAKSIKVKYYYYANVMDAGSSVLNREQAYFNGANLFMHVRDRYMVGCTLRVVDMEPGTKVASALLRTNEENVFRAASYHDFVDSPTILSKSLLTLKREVDNVMYYLHFQGKFEGGMETHTAMLDNVEKIIREQAAIFGKVPMDEYHFIYQLLPYNMRHAVEHKYSACFTLPSSVAKSPEAANGMYGITSHEFFHLWNVKRIRPEALWPYDYQKEVYTTLHWFTEGVTEYYTHLTLVRGGVIDEEKFFATMGRTIERLDNSYANDFISPSQSSFDSWLARSEYGSPHLRTSYYPQGERVGMFLDLELRKVSAGTVDLDKVMSYLYQEYYLKELGVPEDGVQMACEKLTGESFDTFFKRYVHGTERFPYNSYLKPYGLELNMETRSKPGLASIGIESADQLEFGLYLKSVRPGSDASLGGLSDGDILLTINGVNATEFDVEEWQSSLKKNDKVEFTVFSDGNEVSETVVYSGRFVPMTYTLDFIKSKPSKKQRKKLDEWLGSSLAD